MIPAILPTPTSLECALPFAVLGLTVLGVIVGARRSRGRPRVILIAGLLVAALLVWALGGRGPVVIHGTWFIDDLGLIAGLVALLALAASALLGECRSPAALGLLAAAGFGALTACVAHDLIVMLFGLSITHVALAGAAHRPGSGRGLATGRYAIIGATILTVAWFGAAFLIAATQSTALAAGGATNEGFGLYSRAGVTLLALALAGLAGAAPLHAWLGQAGRAARPTALGAILVVMPLVALVPLLRLLASAPAREAGPIVPVLLAVLATLSLVVGSLMNVVASRVRGWLATAAVVHAGFLVGAAVSAPAGGGAEAATFYAVTIAPVVLAVVAMTRLVRIDGRPVETLESLRGLARAYPARAAALSVALLAAAGGPGTAGFPARLAVLQTMHANGASWLAVIATIATAITLVGVVVVIREMFLTPPATRWDEERATGAQWVATGSIVLVVLLGVCPDLLLDVVRTACRALHATSLP